MKIRKLYKIESAHKVMYAYSERCSESYHGHSGKIEVFLKTNALDEAGMIIDFGKLKQSVGALIDMFDHSVHLSVHTQPDERDFFISKNARWVILPDNTTAETYCRMFKDFINEILPHVDKQNGEGDVYCCGVRYHETDTGYAESEDTDMPMYSLKDVLFSKRTLEQTSQFMRDVITKIKENTKDYVN